MGDPSSDTNVTMEVQNNDMFIFKMPDRPKTEWVNATEFTSAQTPIEWDMLLNRGDGLPPKKDFSRESLFVNFDPLVQQEKLERLVESPDVCDTSDPGADMSNSEEQEEEVKQFDSFVQQEVEEDKLEISLVDSTDACDALEVDTSLKNLSNSEQGIEQFENSEAPQTAIAWSTLLNRGEGLPPTKDFSRESLYVNFDPLVQHQLYVPEAENNIKQGKVELEIVKETENEANQIKVELEIVEEIEIDVRQIKTETEIVKESFELDMLLNRGEGLSPKNNLLRESLYVNFDPLAQQEKLERLVESPSMCGDTSDPGADLSNSQEQEAIKQFDSFVLQEVEEDKLEISLVDSTDVCDTLEMIEEAKNDIKKIKAETEIAKEDLNDVETAFAEVLLCYESGKAYIKNYEKNQSCLKNRAAIMENILIRQEEKRQFLEAKENEVKAKMNADHDARMKILDNERFKLRASLKMSELKVLKLENEIEHYSVESNDLQKLWDEMIQRC